MRSLSGGGIACISPNSSVSDVEGLQDSVSKRRRHGMYFYRPPVWRYSSIQDGSSSPDMSEGLNGSDESLQSANQQKPCLVATGTPPRVAVDTDSDHETPLLDGAARSQLALPGCRHSSIGTIPHSFRQTKPAFCTRLQSYKDIRLGKEEQWSIQVGSLVIGIGPEYTLLDGHERRPDEFGVAAGDVYVVCSLYADLWALCAKVSFNSSSEGVDPMRLAFLPLCAVTLAPNYSAFIQRSITCIYSPASNGHNIPGNGLPVLPPRRSHSLIASKQIFRNLDIQVSIPLVVQNVFQSISVKHTDNDFVPLDSRLEPLFASLTSRRQRLLRRIGSGKSLSKFRDSGKQQTRRKYDYDSTPSLKSLCRKVVYKSDGRQKLRKERQRSSSGDSQALKWLSSKL
ncbi:hypothetical protein BDW59DRAFT_166727 [Aspergillus cavernicola]|uniref:Uncharacterized protein n=1 Tax=Aspergillus cavernicola TaxID=176166 RepID=A0ABR4HLF7_9EURO